MSDDNGTLHIIHAARATAIPVAIDPKLQEIQAFVVPDGCTLETVEPDDSYLTEPRQTTGTVAVGDVASFAGYVAEFYDEDATTAWVDPIRFRVDAILNDAHRHNHDEDGIHEHPAWRDHRATLQLQRTPEWQRWLALNSKMVDQETFARHIEVCELDIVSPDAATLLEMVSSFYATTPSEFRSSKRLSNGETQLEYVEQIEASAGVGRKLDVPKEFVLTVAPFVGEDHVSVRALLRYRVAGNALKLGFELVRPADVERDVMDKVAEGLRESIRRVYLGSPASAGRWAPSRASAGR